MKKKSFQINGEKGGRPKGDAYISTFVIPKFNLVILTEHQYNTLLSRYGKVLLEKALSIFQKWLATSPNGCKYKGKNNYAHFRSDGWVINEAKISTRQI